MGILSVQIWYINSPLWHMLNWMVKQMKKKGALNPSKTNRNEIPNGTWCFHSNEKVRNFHYDIGSMFLKNADTYLLTTQSL